MSKPTSLRLDANMATSAVFDMLRQMRSPAKSLRTVVLKEGTVALLIESFQFELCVSRSSSEKIYSMERRKIGIETRRQILQGHLAPNKNSGKKGVHRDALFKSAPHERSPCPPKFEDRSQEETLHQEKMRPRSGCDLAKNYLQAQECGQSCVLYFCWSQDNAGAHFKISRRARVRGRFRSINAHAEQKKSLSSGELDTLRRSRNPIVVTASGEVQTNEEATSIGSRSWSLRDSALLEVFPVCPPILVAIRLQHRHCRICLQHVQPKSEVTNWFQETGADHTKKPKPKQKEEWQSRVGRPFARSSWVVGGDHR